MKTNLDEFKTSAALEKDGVNCDLGEGRVFTIRRFSPNNPKVKGALARYYKPYARLIEMGNMPPEKSQEININLFLDVCLVDWRGILDADGDAIPFKREIAFEILKEAPDLFDTLWKFANDYANYKVDLGNS